MANVTISAEAPGVTFIQVWDTSAPGAQEGFLQTMRAQVGLLAQQPGFVSLMLHPSLDGKQIVVYAQWRTEADFEAGINDPGAKKGHVALARWGSATGNLYQVSDVVLAQDRDDAH